MALWQKRLAVGAAVAAFGLISACAPAPGPGPVVDAAPTTTVAPPASPPTTAAPATGYSWTGNAARSTYKLTYASGTPQSVIDSMSRAAAAVTQYAGITFTSDTASTGQSPSVGEIRVQLGYLCSGAPNPSEAGCAVTWFSGGAKQLLSADVSIAPESVDATYLDGVTFHELGHSVGLGHVDPATAGTQIMNPTVSSNILTYQAGDRAGLGVVNTNKYQAQPSMLPSALLFPSTVTHALEMN